MANKVYYNLVFFTTPDVNGPYTFKEALENKEFYDEMGVENCITKLIIDFNGKEVL